MIVCKKCGFINADTDTFCGSDGAFLEWTGEKVTPPAPPESAPATPEPAEPARRGGFIALVQQVTAIGVPKKEALDAPGTTPGAPMPSPGVGPRPAVPAGPAPLGAPTPRPVGPSGAPANPVLGAPPSSAPPSSPPRSAPPSGPPSSPPPGVTPGSAPPAGPPSSGPPRSAPPIGPPPGVTPPLDAAETPSASPVGPVAPTLPIPGLPPPMLPAPKAAPVVIRVTPEAKPDTIAQASSPQAPSEAPAKLAEPGGVQPVAVRTGVVPKPTVAPPSKQLSAGDLICGQCGEGNEPVRKFCRRCGNSLATAEVASTPRSRRFLPQRKAKVLAAGERPERSKFSFATVVRVGSYVVVAVVLIGGIAYGALPQVRDAINSRVSSTVQAVTGNAPRPTLVKATSLTASSATAGHPAARAIDPYINTYWAASLSTDAHPKLTVAFAHAENVSVMLFISGDTAAEASEPRPKTLHIVFSNGALQDITLGDSAKTQQFSINGAQSVTGVTIQIMSVYSSTSGNAVALGDLEFFGSQ